MMMMMTQRQVQRQVISLEQKQGYLLTQRLSLVGALHNGVNYQPEGACPKCGRKLTHTEIIQGFNEDPNDFTTACSGCGHRFRPKLIWRTSSGNGEIPFLCAVQTLGQMKGLESLSPEEIQRREPSVYHSALVHFGLLSRAFGQLGIRYTFSEVSGIREKIEPFLGRMPDTQIAELSGLSPSVVRRMRRKRRILAFSISDSFD